MPAAGGASGHLDGIVCLLPGGPTVDAVEHDEGLDLIRQPGRIGEVVLEEDQVTLLCPDADRHRVLVVF